MSRKWIGLLPSRSPSDRELQALRAIAGELARSGVGKAVALVHGTRASEEVAGIFLSQGVDVLLLLPFGVLTRKALSKQAGRDGAGMLTLASAAPANGKWSRQLFAQTMDMLRQNAEAVLLSDPDPEWLTGKGLTKWVQMPISYVRYETTSAAMRDTLTSAGARPIGRRSEDGVPNIDFLIGTKQAAVSKAGSSSTGGVPEEKLHSTAHNDDQSSCITLALTLGGNSEASRREIFDILMQTTSSQVVVTVKLPSDASEADQLRLKELGFSETHNS